ncbi:polyprenyl synthetase family protein [Candidatus Woesearchaeota archaeon]|nr:polyprenyl synthetase family protein [Candidatus Woesearchaeota archaeon]
MIREDYEREKRRISEEVSVILDDILEDLGHDLGSKMHSFCSRLINKRRFRAKENGRLRDVVVYLGLKSLGLDRLNAVHYRIIAAGELFNIASYYQNWHLDDKSEVRTEDDKKMCHIASHLFRESAHKTINNSELGDRNKLKLLQALQRSNTAIQYGQSLELSELNFHNGAHKQAIESFLPNYLKRCYWFSGVFYGASFAIAPIILDAGDEAVETYKHIGELFGTGGQIVNDVGDFCLSRQAAACVEKDYQDQFADLVKGTVTLPIWELSQYSDLQQYTVDGMTAQDKKCCLQQMLEHRAFDSSRRLTNKLKNEALRKVDALDETPYRKYFKSMLKTFFGSNKFYTYLRRELGYDWSLASKNVPYYYNPCSLIDRLEEDLQR